MPTLDKFIARSRDDLRRIRELMQLGLDTGSIAEIHLLADKILAGSAAYGVYQVARIAEEVTTLTRRGASSAHDTIFLRDALHDLTSQLQNVLDTGI